MKPDGLSHMILLTFLRKARVAGLVRAFFAGGSVVHCAASAFATPPNYVVVDLTATEGCGDAYAASVGAAAGTVSTPANFLDATHAALWTGNSLVDLHPLALLGSSANAESSVQGFSGNLQVGWGIGPNTGMRLASITWRGTARSAAFLKVPFVTYAAQAVATDGVQIVGFARTHGGPYHALVWNATTGAVTDLGAEGNGAQALCVAHGQQAGLHHAIERTCSYDLGWRRHFADCSSSEQRCGRIRNTGDQRASTGRLLRI